MNQDWALCAKVVPVTSWKISLLAVYAPDNILEIQDFLCFIHKREDKLGMWNPPSRHSSRMCWIFPGAYAVPTVARAHIHHNVSTPWPFRGTYGCQHEHASRELLCFLKRGQNMIFCTALFGGLRVSTSLRQKQVTCPGLIFLHGTGRVPSRNESMAALGW